MKELLAFLVTIILVIIVIILYTRDPEKKDDNQENEGGKGSGSGSGTADTLNIAEIVPSYLYPTFVYSDKNGKLLKCSLNI